MNDSNVRGYDFSIYNRWGELIFQTFSPLDKWDGTNGRDPSLLEVYLFVLKGEVTDCVGQIVPLKESGDVTLIR